jgi:streptogramin lyase
MKNKKILSSGVAAIVAVVVLGAPVLAATTVQVGASGKTYASSAVQCAANPTTGALSPVVEGGLFNPKGGATATVSLNGTSVAAVTAANPATNVWLADGYNTVVVALNKKTADSYVFTVQAGMCDLPDTSGNTFSADGTLEYAASGKSYTSVTPGCALNPATGLAQPYVHLVDNGNYLLNVSINGVPLTQLSATRPHVPVFLSAGQNVISAANGYVSTDYYVRDGGDGACTLP